MYLIDTGTSAERISRRDESMSLSWFKRSTRTSSRITRDIVSSVRKRTYWFFFRSWITAATSHYYSPRDPLEFDRTYHSWNSSLILPARLSRPSWARRHSPRSRADNQYLRWQRLLRCPSDLLQRGSVWSKGDGHTKRWSRRLTAIGLLWGGTISS